MTEEHWQQRMEKSSKYGAPLHEVTHPEWLPCPWCLADNMDTQDLDKGPGPFECSACRKEFVVVSRPDDLIVHGLLSPGDLRYREWESQR